MEEHAPRFLLFARQRARFDADAEDLVQEAVLEAVQKMQARIEELRPAKGSRQRGREAGR